MKEKSLIITVKLKNGKDLLLLDSIIVGAGKLGLPRTRHKNKQIMDILTTDSSKEKVLALLESVKKFITIESITIKEN